MLLLIVKLGLPAPDTEYLFADCTKATQGDTGHAQAQMVTEVYAHILDEERKINAQKFEVAFYANPDMRKVEQELRQPETEQGADLQKLLTQLQENPELAAQLKALLNAK